MGIRDIFRIPTAAATASETTAALASFAGGVADPSTFPIGSPWAGSSHLQRIVLEDIFGSDLPMNTREAAMRLGPVARSRNLLCATIARLPLRQTVAGVLTPDQPAWLTRVDGGASPELRMAWTVDDLIFYGWSLWTKVPDPDTGELVPGSRVNMGEWSVNADGRVEIQGVVQPADRVLLIPGVHEGILSFGRDVLEDARALSGIVRQRLRNPTPQLELHQTAGPDLTREEVEQLVSDWTKARNAPNGGVGYTSQHIELKEHGSGGEQLMIEARNASAVDLARIVGVHAGMVDATAPKASLNYETTQGRNLEFVDFDLAVYTLPIVARLSLDDVTAPGSRIELDLSDFTAPAPSSTGPTLED